MIVLAIAATIASICWSVFVVMANGMSDAPQLAFQGVGSIALAGIVTIVLWVSYAVG